MSSRVHQLGAAVLAGLLVLGGFAPAVQAAPWRPNFPVAPVTPVNPNFQIAPGLTLNQAAYNTAVIGRAISNIPPYALGYNPYTAPVISSGPVVNTGGYPSPLLTGTGYGSGLGYGSTLSTYPGLQGTAGGYPSSATLSTNPLGGGYDPGTAAPGYGGYPYPYYGEDPLAGFMRGSADLVNATGNYYKNVQSARLIQTQADDSRIDYRRRLIDEARYERMNMMTTEELRQQQLARDLARALHQPPIQDVISAKALNDILNNLTNNPARGKGPNIPIDEEVLQRINVTSPTDTTSSVGLLRDEGNLVWPQALMVHEFELPRKHLTQVLADVVQGLKFNNPVKSGDITDLKTDLDQLRKLVDKSELSPTDYIAAKTYLDQVDASIRALQNPNVANYFNYKFSAKNVAEVVDNMSSKGLQFAPAAPGDSWAYKVLHQAMAAYDTALGPQPSAPQAPAPAPGAAPLPDTDRRP